MIQVAGRVFSRDSREPVGSARIRFTREGGAESHVAESAPNGTYRVGLPDARYRMLVSHPDFIDPQAFSPGFLVASSRFANPNGGMTANFFLVRRPQQRWVNVDSSPGIRTVDVHLGDFFGTPRLPLVGDFDGDGFDEIAYTREGRPSAGNDFWCIKASPRTGSWTYLGGNRSRANLAFDASAIGRRAGFGAVGDFDGDGRDEIALQISDPNSLGNDFWVMDYDPARGRWQHLSGIAGHRGGADLDCSGSSAPARFAVAGDFDGDGVDELAVGIGADGSGGNDLWVMKYDPRRRRWDHLSPIRDHSRRADLDCSGTSDEARFAVAGDFDGDGVDELAVAIKGSGSRGNDFWVMKYDPGRGRWRHLSPIPEHPARADLDCSGSRAFAVRGLAADVDNNGRDELVVALDRRRREVNDLWVMGYDPDTGTWSHTSRGSRSHPLDADIDPSTESLDTSTLTAADVDGDGVPELVVGPDAEGSRSNDLWVMKYDHTIERWGHLSPSGRSNASVDLSTRSEETEFVVAGRFGAGSAGHRAQVVAAVRDDSDIALANPNFWVVRYAVSERVRTQARGRVELITESRHDAVGTRTSTVTDAEMDLLFDNALGTVRVIGFSDQSDSFDTPLGQNTTTLKFRGSDVGDFDPVAGSVSNLRLSFLVDHSIRFAGDSTLALTLTTFGRLPARHEATEGEHINGSSGSFVAIGQGRYRGGFLGGDRAYVRARMTLDSVPA